MSWRQLSFLYVMIFRHRVYRRLHGFISEIEELEIIDREESERKRGKSAEKSDRTLNLMGEIIQRISKTAYVIVRFCYFLPKYAAEGEEYFAVLMTWFQIPVLLLSYMTPGGHITSLSQSS